MDEALGHFTSNLINQRNKEYSFSRSQFSNQIQFEALKSLWKRSKLKVHGAQP